MASLSVAGVVLLLSLCQAQSAWNVRCPLPRICEWGCDLNNKIIYCSDSMLGPYSPELPNRHSNTTWKADFSHNGIVVLQDRAFYVSETETILFELLDYSFNFIREVRPSAFEGQENSLKMLDLSNNQLTQLHTEIFQSLAVLQKLIVSNNKLTSLDFVCNSALPRLSQLHASNNSIENLPESCFFDTRLGMKENSALTLDSNKLTSLDPCTFKDRTFEELSVHGNTLTCSCGMPPIEKEMCTLPHDGRLVQWTNYTAECTQKRITCLDLYVTAVYRKSQGVNSSVVVNWSVKNFAMLKHYKVNLLSLTDSGIPELIGEYQVPDRHTRSLTIQVPNNHGVQLIACVAAVDRQDHILLPSRQTHHTECRRVSQGNSQEHIPVTLIDFPPAGTSSRAAGHFILLIIACFVPITQV